jgi:hypothetical protein
MGPDKINKRASNSDVLRAIEEGNVAQAVINATMVGKISAISNELSDFKTTISGYLENNDKTNQPGGIEQIANNKKDISTIRGLISIVIGVFTVFGIVGGFILEALGFFKK